MFLIKRKNHLNDIEDSAYNIYYYLYNDIDNKTLYDNFVLLYL